MKKSYRIIILFSSTLCSILFGQEYRQPMYHGAILNSKLTTIAEIHILSEGGHGFGLAVNNEHVASWTFNLKLWLDALKKKNTIKVPPQFVSVANPNIEYIGRWDKSNKDVYVSHWAGAYVRVRFAGKNSSVKLQQKANIYCSVDGKENKIVQDVSGNFNLNSELLEDREHTLILASTYDDVELWVEGIYIDKNAKLLPPGKKRKFIEFIGASVLVGDETTLGNQSAYSWLVAQELGCDHATIAYRGIPVTDGYHWDYEGAPLRGLSVQYFSLKQPNYPPEEMTWNFMDYTPDIILFHGGNDKGLKVPPAQYKESLINFIVRIRDHSYKCPILILYESYEKETIELAEYLRLNGDKNIYHINIEGWLVEEDRAPRGHPTDEGQCKLAKHIIPILKPLLKD